MKRKCVLVFLLALLVAGGLFAQSDFYSMPKNTLTVDFGPTLLGASFGKIGDLVKSQIDGGGAMDASGFGIGAQYERQLSEHFSLALRGAYLKVGLDATIAGETNGINLDSSFSTDLTSFSAEAHVRYYPFGQTFFLNGMAGYGNLAMPLSGRIVGSYMGQSQSRNVDFSSSRSYVKYGGKIGWRIDFGRPGGLIFEPAFGYYGKFGLGETLWNQLMDSVGEEIGSFESPEVEKTFDMLEKFVFIGGPRFTLSFGWRF